MPIMRWKPLEELDEFFDHYFRFGPAELATDIYEDDQHVYVEINIAGIDPQTLDIQINDQVLRVRGSREEMHEKKGKHYARKEIRRGNFERTFTLPASVEAHETTRAAFDKGTLKITLPKAHHKKSNKIKIDVKQ